MKEKTTKYTNIISIILIIFAAIIFFFKLPSNQINLPSENFDMLFFMLGIICFTIFVVVILYIIPMFFIIKQTCTIPIPYLSLNRVNINKHVNTFHFVETKKYQKLCVIRC
jgi:hypothetical protein